MTEEARGDQPTADGPAPESAPAPGAEFGPGGYLPGKAAKRARKIVLRAELGLQWVIAAVVAAALLLVAGVVWYQSQRDTLAGFESVVDASFVDEPGKAATDAQRFFAVNDEGRVRVFAWIDPSLTFCRSTGHLEAHLGQGTSGVWSLTGRPLNGAEPLSQYPVVLGEDGLVYADPDAPLPAPQGRDEGVEPTCLD